MSDQNMVEFYKRAARLERDRARGMGFEAPGALGRSYYYRAAPPRRSLLWPALFLIAVAFLMKAGILYATGASVYNDRVASLKASTGVVEQAGGWLMQVDPATAWLSQEIAMGVAKVKAKA